jgi:hypothetical protein
VEYFLEVDTRVGQVGMTWKLSVNVRVVCRCFVFLHSIHCTLCTSVLKEIIKIRSRHVLVRWPCPALEGEVRCEFVVSVH